MRTGKSTGIIRKGIGVYYRVGIMEFSKRALRYAIAPFFGITTYNIYEINLKEIVTEVKPKAEDCSVAIANSYDQIKILLSEGINFTADPEFDSYGTGFDNGAFLFLVSIGGRLAHTSWVALRHDEAVFDNIFREIDFGEAGYVGPCNTFEQFRGRNLYPYALSKIFDFIRGRGIGRVVISTRNSNTASIRGIIKAGFMPFCTVRKYKLIGRSIFVKGKSIA